MKSCFPNSPSDFAPDVIGFGIVTVMSTCSQARIFRTVQVAAISNDIEMVSTKNVLGLRCDVGKL